VFERFTESAGRAVVRAFDDAQHTGVGSEHLLAALISDTDVGPVLTELGLTVESVQARFGTHAEGEATFTDDAKRALERAHRDALRAGSTRIDVVHLATGVLADRHNRAARIVMELGVDPAQVRTAVAEVEVRDPRRARPATEPLARPEIVEAIRQLALSPGTRRALRTSAKAAALLTSAGIGRGSMPIKLLGTVNKAVSTVENVNRAVGPAATSSPQVVPARCSFCHTASPECGPLFTGATGALICAHCVDQIRRT
jgi:ATP-dependent Clp protease ATP-binding subunit ClpA